MTASAAPAYPRLASLDVFRGLTIATMILVNNAGGPAYAPLRHAEWHGWTLTDLVFPFFLFIVGVAVPFSFAKRAVTDSRREMLGHVWSRALSLWMLGQLLFASNLPLPFTNEPNGFLFTKAVRLAGFVGVYGAILALLWPWRSKRVSTWLPVVVALLFYGYWIAMHFVRVHAIEQGWSAADFGGGIFNPDRLRIPGVLQRIGVCYGIAATIALFVRWRGTLAWIVLLCAVYSTLMLFAPSPGHRVGSLTADDNFARHIDVAVFNFAGQVHTYGVYPDPEGLVSSLPAIASVLIGVLVGQWLRTDQAASKRAISLLAMSLPVIAIGLVLDRMLMPINKSLWTPSFTVFTAGAGMLCLGMAFWVCDVLRWRRWALPLTIFGMNAIAAFVASSLVLRLSRYLAITDVDGKSVALHTLFNRNLTAGMNWLAQYVLTFGIRENPSLIEDDPGMIRGMLVSAFGMRENQSLAYALSFVGLIFVLMAVLYARRIFVKV